MDLYTKLLTKQAKLSVIGLGYVGMPLAVAFDKKDIAVIGFDLNSEKIDLYRQGLDPTFEVGSEALKHSKIFFTDAAISLREANFHIIAVPTPINIDKTPDLCPVENASVILGRNLSKGSVVVYESTVYPGVTEDICIPILERESGLKCGQDFLVGYSPERINPGDKVNRLENIVKIVAGLDSSTLDIVAKVYELIIEVGVYRAESVKVAEAAKVVENSQRDINIAFMNELAMVFDKMKIDTNEVIKAMNTKWNALKFYPGLVGGHCIGIDPYYFIYQAAKLGYHSQIILAGRKINDGMGQFIADAVIKELVLANKKVIQSKVYILGITFKENCPDIRNSKVTDVITRLQEYGINPIIIDPWADVDETASEYGLKLDTLEDIHDADCLIFAVAHQEFKNLSLDKIASYFNSQLPQEEKIIIDVKSILDKYAISQKGYRYWNL
ncbi:nucleotide sugar dehydrogenase [Succinispira mobilis]|uniref:nucleotide sugar dehydrogenase n=1 Tax=Succinispira mobilis TaxID=78120 RepID=UPI000376D708|nr:nucleotide sugar dehydrogenase [Succinispira mobilis]